MNSSKTAELSKATISKYVGWEEREGIEVPDKTRALDLYKSVENGDVYAAIEVLTIHRFTESPINDKDKESMYIIIKCVELIDKW